MKKILTTILILFTLLSAACSTASSENQSAANASKQSLSTEAELIVGTLKLEGTTQAVTAEQASKLLPLWQLRKELSTNSAAAPQEIQAVIDQIQSTMTTEQVQAIDNMKLTQQDAMTLVQEQGNTTQSSAKQSSSQSQNNGGGFAPPDGGPGGGIPGMGPSMGTTSSTTTQSAQLQSTNDSSASSSAMIDVIIQYLQKKVGA